MIKILSNNYFILKIQAVDQKLVILEGTEAGRGKT